MVAVGFDLDLPDQLALRLPELYRDGLGRVHFNTFVFVTWMIFGVYHGCIAWFVPSAMFGAGDADVLDWGGTFWVSSVVSFTLVLVFVSARLWLVSLNPLAPKTVLVLLFSWLLYVLWLIILGHTMLGESMQPQM